LLPVHHFPRHYFPPSYSLLIYLQCDDVSSSQRQFPLRSETGRSRSTNYYLYYITSIRSSIAFFYDVQHEKIWSLFSVDTLPYYKYKIHPPRTTMISV